MRIVICDDDRFLLGIITDYVKKTILDNNMESNVIFTTNNYNDMEEFISTNEADLYLLDVDLKSGVIGKDGLLLAQSIMNKGKFVLFITGSTTNINKIFEVKAYNCLTKPINLEYLEYVLRNIYKEYISNNQHNKHVNISCINNKTYRVKCCDIMHIDKLDDECIIYMVSGEQIKTTLTLQCINNMCDNLDRVHKSFLCNAEYIHSIDHRKKEITMINGNTICLGGIYKDKFYQKIKM